MNVIIVGIGNVGEEIVEQLTKEGHNLVVVDNNPDIVNSTVDEYDVKGVYGNGASYEVLREAGVSTADLLIACTQYDEMNILSCLVAKKLGVRETIARIRNSEYFTLFMSAELGINMMVSPEYEVAKEITRILRYPSAIKIEPFADGKVDLVELKIDESSPLAGLKLSELHSKLDIDVLVCAVLRNNEVFIPSGDFAITAGDRIYVTASDKTLYKFFRALGLVKGSKNVMVIGGSRTAFFLAADLEKIGMHVKIIEKDANKCAKLNDALDKTEVILGDGTDWSVLVDEGVTTSDAVVCLCGIDEQNVIISMLAASENVKKVVAKVEKDSYYGMLANSGVDSVVSTRNSTADQIVRYVRNVDSARHGGSVNKLYKIVNDKAEALEFTVHNTFKAIGKPLKDISFARDTLIGGIIRNGKFITPRGNDSIEVNDGLIVITKNESLAELNDILE